MALAKRNINISLSQGVDTKSDPKQVIPGKLLSLQNGVLQTAEEIRKRNGYQGLPTTVTNLKTISSYNVIPSNVGSGNFLANFNNEDILNDGFHLYSQSPSTSSWVYKGNSPVCNLTTSPIVRNANNQTAQDCAANANAKIFAWEDSSTGGVMLCIVDSNTGQVILNNYPVSATGIAPKCIAISGRLYCFYYDSGDNILHYVYWNGTSISSAANAATNINTTNPNFDVITLNQTIYVAYNGTGSTVKVSSFTPFMTVTNTISKGEVATNCITCFSDPSNNIWIAYNNNVTTKAFIVDSFVSATVLAPTAVEIIANVKNITGAVIGTTATIFYDVLFTAVNGYYINSKIRMNTLTVAGVAGTAADFMRSATLQSRAFLVPYLTTYITHLTVVHDAYLQPSYFVVALYNTTSFAKFTVVSKICPSVAGSVPTRSQLCNAFALSSTQFNIALLQKDQLFLQSTTTGGVATFTQTGVTSAILNFSYTNPNALQLGNNLHFGGGYLQMYDGSTVCEHGFHLYPDSKEMTFTAQTSGGHLTDSSTYGVIVVYEWVDNQGQVHQSAPSPGYSVTVGNSTTNACSIDLVIPTLRITGKSNVNIVIYRTGANGTVYYRDNLPSSPLANSLTANTVSYTISQADTTVIANEQLYTTGGEVSNIAAPASSVMCIYQNRIILIPSEDTFSWWFSKQVISGVPVEFSNVFVESIDSFAGGITACKEMDNNLILFKQNIIYPINGQGPAPNGTNNDFSSPIPLAVDTGCDNPQSLVLTQMGLMYQSPKGIYLLDRSLHDSYIGAPVEAFNSETVTSAQLIQNANQIRFTTSSGTALVYDYYFKQWYTFTNHAAVSSINTQGLFTFLSSAGLVLQETVGAYNDNGNFIPLKFVLAPLSLAGIQGFQRIYEMLILGTYKSPHQLLVKIGYDFNSFFSQQDYVNATVLVDQNIYGEDALYGSSTPYGGTNTPYQWRIFFSQQKCQAISISIEDVQPLGLFTNTQGLVTNLSYGEGYSLSNIALRFGVKEGLYKLPASSAFG